MFKWKEFHFDFLWNFLFLVTVSSLWISVMLLLQVCGLSLSRRLKIGFIWLDFFLVCWLVLGYFLGGLEVFWGFVLCFGVFLLVWGGYYYLFVSWIAESLDPLLQHQSIMLCPRFTSMDLECHLHSLYNLVIPCLEVKGSLVKTTIKYFFYSNRYCLCFVLKCWSTDYFLFILYLILILIYSILFIYSPERDLFHC